MNDYDQALEDINLIKKIIYKAQKDFSGISNFFLGVALLNAFFVILKIVSYTLITDKGYDAGVTQALISIVRYKNISLMVFYVMLYLYYRTKIKNKMDNFGLALVNIWGIIFIGIGLFALIISNKNIDSVQAVEFVSILMGICITALLIKKEWILIFCVIISGFYMFALTKDITFVVAMNGESRVLETMSSIIVDVMKSLGILLLYMSVRSRKHEDRANTGRTK